MAILDIDDIWNIIDGALEEARKLPYKYRHVAVALENGRILAQRPNLPNKTHPTQAKIARLVGCPEKIYLHAEVNALIHALRQGNPDQVIVVRVKKDGTPAMSEPCPICKMAMAQAGIKTVVYTTDDPNSIEIIDSCMFKEKLIKYTGRKEEDKDEQ